MSMRRKGIPENAKKVFSGKIFSIWQWEQKMFDGSTEIFERIERPNTAQIIPVVGDSILILKEEQPDIEQPFLSLPGGRCDDGKDPLDAAKRELLEETGYVSDDWVPLEERDPHRKTVWTMYTYIARRCVFKENPHLDAGEKIKPIFLDFDGLLALSDDPSFRGTTLVELFLRKRLDPKAKEDFRKLLFEAKATS